MRTANALGAALLALALAGCPLNHSSTMSLSSNASSSTSGSSGASPEVADSAPRAGRRGVILRDQLETLRGMTPDEAKAQLKRFGHDGNVLLGEVIGPGGGHDFDAACGVNRVCDTSGGSGISVHADITLLLNRTLTVAPPPP